MSRAEKYIDLAPTVVSQVWGSDADQKRVLHWLDEHRDQTPGPTITESEFDEVAGTSSPARREDFRRFLSRKNFTVVPDPKPTNAERIEALISKSDFRPVGYHGVTAVASLARDLDKAGVKAPGGDDEH